MSIKGTDPILGPSRGDPDKFFAVFVQSDQKDRAYVDAVARWAPVAGVDSAIVFDQFAQETTEPTITPLSPGTSTRWNRDLNPGGIGIPLDTTKQPVVIATGDEAARIHVQCLYSLVKRITHPGVPIPPAWLPWFTTVWLPKVCDVLAPQVKTIADLNIRYVDATGESRATWAWDANYLSGLLAYAQKWLPDVRDAGKDGPMSYHPIHVDQAITPWTNANRDGGKLDLAHGELNVTVHGTGNPNPGADRHMHGRWQASADAARIPASVHGYVDDTGFTQTLPLDEIAYHAGDGCNDIATDAGCFRSVAIEICEASTVDHAAANEIAAQVLCMIVEGDPRLDWGGGATKGTFDYDHFQQHIWQSQEVPPHDCPNRIRHDDDPPWDWAHLMSRIDYWQPIIHDALQPIPGPSPTPAPKPPKPPKTKDLSKLPVPGIPLPKGLTTAYLKRRYAGNDQGVVVIDGERVQFSPNGAISRKWLRRAIASIPKGKDFTEGRFPAIVGKTARFTDGQEYTDWEFQDGSTIPALPKTGGKGLTIKK